MFIYYQDSGRFLHRSGESSRLFAHGYSGFAPFVNDPKADHIRSKGPLPKGEYRLRVVEHPRFAAPAIQCEQTLGRSYGRSGFFIHGDNRHGNRTASTGCIILNRDIRREVASLVVKGDTRLLVLGGDEDEVIKELVPGLPDASTLEAVRPATVRSGERHMACSQR